MSENADIWTYIENYVYTSVCGCAALRAYIHKTLLKWWQTASQLQYNT